jgi:hypothetical protein
MKWRDEIVEEVRAAREAYAARFDFDLWKIAEDLKKKEALHPEDLAPLQPVTPHAHGKVR